MDFRKSSRPRIKANKDSPSLQIYKTQIDLMESRLGQLAGLGA